MQEFCVPVTIGTPAGRDGKGTVRFRRSKAVENSLLQPTLANDFLRFSRSSTKREDTNSHKAKIVGSDIR